MNNNTTNNNNDNNNNDNNNDTDDDNNNDDNEGPVRLRPVRSGLRRRRKAWSRGSLVLQCISYHNNNDNNYNNE